MTTLAVAPAAPALTKFKSFGILDAPIRVEWHAEAGGWDACSSNFLLHEQGKEVLLLRMMPIEKLERIQRELQLQAGSIIDFGNLPDERRRRFRACVTAAIEGMRLNMDQGDLHELINKTAWVHTSEDILPLDIPEMFYKNAWKGKPPPQLTVDVAAATQTAAQPSCPSPPPSQYATEGAVYRMFKHFKAFDGHASAQVLADDIERECDMVVFDDFPSQDYILQKLCQSHADHADGRERYSLTHSGFDYLLSHYEPTSPDYPPDYSPVSA